MGITSPAPLEERFNAKWTPEPNSGCWLWTANVNRGGYGQIGLGAPTRKLIKAHRASWLLAHGHLPPDKYVCHKCDNRACVNPDHLYLGTHGDNMADMARKGRSPMLGGRMTPNAKLTADDVRAIRLSPLTGRELAPQYGVSESSIRYARNGKGWQHVK